MLEILNVEILNVEILKAEIGIEKTMNVKRKGKYIFSGEKISLVSYVELYGDLMLKLLAVNLKKVWREV
jgi:hypothetical protein